MEHDAAQIESTTTAAPTLEGRSLAAPHGGGGRRSARLARVQRTAGNRIAAASVQRRTQVGLEGGPVGADFEQGLQSARSGGRPIEESVRRSLEGTIGADLADVRLHSGAQSAELNEQISAKAFTVGTDIFFREGVPDTSTTSGQHLLAHEVAHTVQQTGGAQRRVIRRDLVSNPTVDPSRFKNASAEGSESRTREAAPKTSLGLLTAAAGGASGTSVVSSENQYQSDMEKLGNGPASEMPGADKADSIDVGAGAGETVIAFFNVYRAYKAITDGSNDEKLLAGLDMAHALTSVGAGVSKLTEKGSSVDSGGEAIGKSGDATLGLAGITDSFGAVKAAFTAASTLIELLKNSEEYSTLEQRRMKFELLRNATEAARSGVSAARNFLDLAGGTVTAGMVQTVPGLGLALSAADVAVRLYDLAVARLQTANMATRAETLQTELTRLQQTPSSRPSVAARIAALQQEIATATSLQYINDKRQDRSYLKLAVAAGRIAGDIATLGGASAPVGIGLKVAALALDVGASIFRKAKQWFRDKNAEPTAATAAPPLPAKGAKLTTAGKHAEYNRMIDNVLDIIKKVFTGGGATRPIDAADASKGNYDPALMPVATNYMDAIGYTVEAMQRDINKTPDGSEVRKSMLKALRRRE